MYSTTGIDASNYVSTFNTAFYYIGGISLILLIALTVTMLYFVFKFNKKKNKVASQIEGNTTLEVLWTVIPIILAMSMFHFGWAGWKPVYNPPKDAMNITSTARMWSFSFSYDNGKQSPDLVVPVNTPVKVNLISLDVIHSLFIPQFRIKSDIVPGRKKFMWFLPEAIGKYQILCAEYCGLRHSYMSSSVNVLSKADFDKWYAAGAVEVNAAGVSAAGAEGLGIMKIQGCFACHSIDGTKIVGPTYLNLYGSQVTVTENGKEITLKADDEYIKHCINDPNSRSIQGYPKGLMQSYKDKLSDADISKIIEFLKTLKN
jgi:cytochrome c oxidase subunit II